MSRTITVGFDGSLESRAAAEWAAREATLRGARLLLVHVWEGVPEFMAETLGADALRHKGERLPREAAAGLRGRHPGLDVAVEQTSGHPMDVLPRMAEDAGMLVLGSRGLSGVGGFLVGSVGMVVITRTETPVVLVRSGGHAEGEYEKQPAGAPPSPGAYRPVVLGLDTDHPHDSVISFAFEEAARRGTALKAVHGWKLPPYYAYALPADPRLGSELHGQQAAALAETLLPWRKKYPEVEVIEESRSGSPADRVIDASREASLVVVGRRIRRGPLGARIGTVTHAVLHHATAPVAVVAHD
ncbi:MULTISPECIES: universal stress protein [Streptomyces]|uniref:Stress-inducible protein n=1 Tax=Streptomyces fungicidicus TaxID=68203 RepID=A0A494UZP9_9ACTN|nr:MULTISPECIES: universal stress protein [Streptomyces]AYL39980.1 stress-inducible protein [Streptomyces fungicidicus]QKW03914.1 universal stress protein [Streptomyces sp. NA02536]